jgi:uncharacterized protein YcaQ
VVRGLTLLQIDPIAASAPNADLMAWSRLGTAYSPGELDEEIGDLARWLGLSLDGPGAVTRRPPG